MTPLDISVRIERAEWIRLNFRMAYRNPILIASVFVGILTGLMAFVVQRRESEVAIYSSIFGILIAIFNLVVIPASIWRRAEKQLVEDRFVNQEVEYSFTPDRVMVTAKGLHLSLDWKEVKSMAESQDWFTIMTDRQHGLFIPIRCLQREQLDGLRAYAARFE